MSDGGSHVLIVDDNVELAENLAELVEELEVSVGVARSAQEAREAFDAHVALAIVDVGLPDASGLELLDQLRTANPDSEVILMTGQGTLESAIAAVRHGAFAYLLKPVDAEELLALVERGLAQVALRRERTALARALASSEALYRGVVENVEAWIVGIDAEDEVRLLNRMAARGLAEEGLELGLLDSDVGVGLPIERIGPAFANAVRRARFGETVGPFEAAIGQGSRIVRWQLTPVTEARTTVSLLALGLDVTEQRQLERRNAKAEALAAIGTLTTGLAHEIRNPLNAASLQLQVLGRRVRQLVAGEQHRAKLEGPVEIVRHELERLSSLLDDFLGLARPGSLRTETIDLGELITHVVRLEAPLCAERGVELDGGAPGGLTAEVERGRFEQVLVNLVANARDALGGEGAIEIRAERTDAGIRLRIGDSGPGFDEAPEQLVEPFFTTKAAGTGLGLTIVRRIVEMHGGDLAFGRSPLGGAEVCITLPSSMRA